MRPEKASRKTTNLGRLIFLPLALLAANTFAQNPVPFVHQPPVPSAVAPGGPAFTLTVNGAGFVSGATVNWDGTPLTTTFVSYKQLTAAVPTSNIAGAMTASITVTNPAPGGGTSNVVPLQVAYKLTTSIVFSDPISYPAPGAYALVAGDFNGDGITDLAVAGDQVAVYLGNGDGTFSPATFYALPGPAGGTAVGDFNGDGKLDLAVTSGYGPAQVSVFLGNGDGTFQPPINSPAGNSSYGLVAGDFNEDGKLDLATADYSNNNITILLGNGDGTFKPPSSTAGGFAPEQVTIGDFNGDGHLDLVALDSLGIGYCIPDCQEYAGVSVLGGNGDGTFTAPGFIETGYSPLSATAADFNHDGILDLAVANTGPPNNPGNTVSVLISEGGNALVERADYNVALGPYSVVAGDFDADGNLDFSVVALTASENNNPVGYIFLGQGDGTFPASSMSFFYPPPSTLMAVGDFNGDGYLDLATASRFGDTLSILLQRPPFSISPGVANFRDQLVGTTDSLGITLTNNASTPLDITGMSITGTNASDFSQTTTCGTSLPQGSCQITVTFTPGALGPRTASLVINDSGPGGSQTVPLEGAGVNPVVTLSSTSLDFGPEPLTVPVTKSVTATVSGVGKLTIASITASGEFTQTNNCVPSVANGASCTINVTFNPTTGGALTGSITIADDAADSPQTITLSGAGVPPTVTLSATSLDFGSLPLSILSAAQTVTLTNNGPGPLTITSISQGGDISDFAQTNNCGNTVPKGGQCVVSITFDTGNPGTVFGVVTITDNAADSPQTIALSGTGLPPTVTLSANSLDFGSRPLSILSAAQTVALTNNGPGPLTITSISQGGDTNDFAQTNNCGNTVPKGGQCVVSITFDTSIPGTVFGVVTITDNAADSPQTISLKGTGVPPTVTLSTTSLTFGSQLVYTTSPPQTVTITNDGPGPLTVSGIGGTVNFVVSPDCAGTLAVSASCTFSVTFSPQVNGPQTGGATISDNGVGSPQTVSLSGTGLGPVASLSPSTLSFPNQLLGTTSAPQTVTLTNTGGAPMTLSGISTASPFAETTNCTATLGAGASCAIQVTFTPATAGSASGSVNVADNSPESPQAVSLTGTGSEFSISLNPTTVSIAPGGTAGYILTVAAASGFNQAIALACSGAPQNAACSVSPNTFIPGGAGPAAVTVTVTTTAPTEALPRWPKSPRAPLPQTTPRLWLLALAFLALMGASAAQGFRLALRARAELGQAAHRSAQAAQVACGLLLLMVLGWAACGGGAGSQIHTPGTPPGTYTLTLTGTSGSLSQSATVTLTVLP